MDKLTKKENVYLKLHDLKNYLETLIESFKFIGLNRGYRVRAFKDILTTTGVYIYYVNGVKGFEKAYKAMDLIEELRILSYHLRNIELGNIADKLDMFRFEIKELGLC